MAGHKQLVLEQPQQRPAHYQPAYQHRRPPDIPTQDPLQHRAHPKDCDGTHDQSHQSMLPPICRRVKTGMAYRPPDVSVRVLCHGEEPGEVLRMDGGTVGPVIGIPIRPASVRQRQTRGQQRFIQPPLKLQRRIGHQTHGKGQRPLHRHNDLPVLPGPVPCGRLVIKAELDGGRLVIQAQFALAIQAFQQGEGLGLCVFLALQPIRHGPQDQPIQWSIRRHTHDCSGIR